MVHRIEVGLFLTSCPLFMYSLLTFVLFQRSIAPEKGPTSTLKTIPGRIWMVLLSRVKEHAVYGALLAKPRYSLQEQSQHDKWGLLRVWKLEGDPIASLEG